MARWQKAGKVMLIPLAGLATPALAVVVTYEKPGEQNSSATFTLVGVETFDSVKTGADKKFKTDFGTGGAIRGSYRDVQVDAANVYGSAGGSGNHAVTFTTSGYSLDLQTRLDGGVTYFGYWLSALDSRNQVTLLSGGKEIFVFAPAAVLNAVGDKPGYFGNPNAGFAGQNKGEPYVFVNFFSDVAFDQVKFSQRSGGGGYESDNHSVGQWITQSGGIVPEPTT